MKESWLGSRPVLMSLFVLAVTTGIIGAGYVGFEKAAELGCRYHQAREGGVYGDMAALHVVRTPSGWASDNADIRVVEVRRPTKPPGAVLRIDDCAVRGRTTVYVAVS